MGNAFHPTVILLRDFRDLYLRQKAYGRVLINFYNTVGPHLASFIGKSKILRFMAFIIFVIPFEFCARLIMGNIKVKRDN